MTAAGLDAFTRAVVATPNEVTRPTIADNLTLKADLLERFGIDARWLIRYELPDGAPWVVEHDRVTLWASTPGDVALARAFRDLRHGVRIATVQQGYAARRRLGLPRER